MQPEHSPPPLNPIPVAVWLIALPMMAFEIVFSLAEAGLIGGADGIGWRLDALAEFAFFPDLMRHIIESGQYDWRHIARLITYPFVHAAPTQTLFAIVMLLAMGKFVGEVFSSIAVLIVFLGSAVLAALVLYLWVGPQDNAPLYGAFPGVYGLIGGFTFILQAKLHATGGKSYQAFRMIGFLMAIQILFALLFNTGWLWLADIAGFVAGYMLSLILRPGGIATLYHKLRQRS